MSENLFDRVQRGVAKLDAIRPDWRSKIDIATLDISRCGYCTLTQLFGGYTEGIRALGLTLIEAEVAHGFELIRDSRDSLWQEFDVLTDLWKAEIQKAA